MELTPFVVDAPQADLDHLRERLAKTRWPDEVDGVGIHVIHQRGRRTAETPPTPST